MKTIKLLSLCLLLSAKTYSQIGWDWAFAISTGPASGLGLDEDSLGNIYVTGFFQDVANFGGVTLTSQTTNNVDAFVAKYDSLQNLVWVKQFGQTQYSFGSSIGVDDSLNVFFNGVINGVAALCKIDANGNTSWQKTISGNFSYFDNRQLLFVRNNKVYSALNHSLRVYSTTGALLSSASRSNVICIAPAYGNKVLVGTNQAIYVYSENLVLQKTISLPSSVTYLASLTADNNCILATGQFSGTLSLGTNSVSGFQDIFITRLDTLGNCLWLTSAGGSSSDGGNSVVLGDNGEVHVAGYYRHQASFDTVQVGAAGLFEEIFVAVCDPATGDFLSVATAGGGGDHDIAYSMIKCKRDGTMLVTGTIYDQWGGVNFGNILINSPTGNTDVFLAKTTKPEVVATISGTITQGGAPSNYALTKLYKVNPIDSTHTQINKKLTPASGTYSYTINEKGTYAVKAVYFGTDYFHTYYPATYIWNLSTHIPITSDTTISNIDIALIPLPTNSDSITISGTVLNADSLPKRFIDVLLVDALTDIPIDFCITDTFGYYVFDSIPPSRYKILVDTAGMFMDSYYEIWVAYKQAMAQAYENFDYIIKADKVYPLLNTFGVVEATTAFNPIIYPNPASEKLLIEQSGVTPSEITATIYSTLGEEILKPTVIELNAIDVRTVPAGTYILKLVSSLGSSFHKIYIVK